MSGPTRSNAPTILALLALLGIGAGLVGLTALVLPQVFGLLAVVVGFFAFGGIHYLLWGWWLRPLPVDNDAPTGSEGAPAEDDAWRDSRE